LNATRIVESGLADARISTGKTIYSVQLLRFMAAAFVVVSHIRRDYQLTPFGDFGVDVFFVISGFIIYYVTRGDTDHFFTRRLIRIVPLYWLGTLLLASIALLAPSVLRDVQFDGPRVLASLFFFPYWTPEHSFHPILLLGWTLNYEILFYFVFFIAMRISHRHRFLVCSALLVSLALSHSLASPGSAYFFWSGPYVIEFIYGMAIGIVVERTRFISVARMPLVITVLALAAYCFLLYPTTGYFDAESIRFVVIGIPSALLVLAVLGCEQSIRSLPRAQTRLISFLGDLSFATYIFHVYIMGLLKRVIGLEMNIFLYSAIVLASSAVVAAAVFLLIESPSRRWLTNLFVRPPRPIPDPHTATAV
jgi:peptidoglycan/LPS O-acetylase OafA/YrhL